MNRRAAELIQYRLPEGLGPSSNTWPRWESLLRALASFLTIPWLVSVFSFTLSLCIAAVKLGQPVRDSNLSTELNKGSPVIIST